MFVGVISWDIFIPNLLITGLPFLFLIDIPVFLDIWIVEVVNDSFFIEAPCVDRVWLIPCSIALAINIIGGCLGFVEVFIHIFSGSIAVNIIVPKNTIS